ncbi:multicomponent Na+:H+ antiporter subunit E [Pontibacter aydingkolensis]|uniref:Na+/H+ antiporter subunit E n=1 Tax=Pontibacter aydingkolensis TaxID=1911536 RepID=A0ABS7CYE9_9BACT|nr:Na+/H+ antiporter subunit E [Pontibacter aydingkolensis]MBW7468537.1 Na+/H+ antiporter subunit E [Pontibacter aydingkolensis]
MKTFYLHSAIAFVSAYLITHQDPPPLPYNAFSTAFVFLVIFWILWSTSWFYNKPYFRKMPKALFFAVFFIKELLVANIKIAYDILTPRYYMRPTVIALPLSVKTDLEITLLACMITLTPGTLSIDVSENRKILYVHALYVKNNDVELLKQYIKNGFERRLLELTT